MAGVLDAAARQGLPAILSVFDGDADAALRRMRTWEARGMQVFTVATDKILLAENARRRVTAARAAP